MSKEERIQVTERIEKLIGTWEDNSNLIEKLDISERIKAREQYRKLREKLEKIAEKGGIKSLQLILINEGSIIRGLTPLGKRIIWEGNNGLTNRSRYCGTLKINGETIYTSGTIAKAFEYILNN